MTVWSETISEREVCDPFTCEGCGKELPLAGFTEKVECLAEGGPNYYHYKKYLVCSCRHRTEVTDWWEADATDF
jgi:hypothetical protein